MTLPLFHKLLLPFIISVAGIATALPWIQANSGSDKPATEITADIEEVVSVFDETVDADSPVELLLNSDDQKIVGWITGPKRFAGQIATIKIDNRVKAQVEIEQNNSFEWTSDKRTTNPIEVSVNENLKASTRLWNPHSVSAPNIVYFVLDRTAYRPGQTFHFAGFLRRETRDGEFLPLPNHRESVVLYSEKNTKAAEIEVMSDEFGRFVGEYKFTDADSLSTYRMQMHGYTGGATVKLAEFRKAKVRLDIDSQRDARKLTLKFQALDFLNKGVEGTDVRFDAKVIYSNAQTSDATLDRDEFAIKTGVPTASLLSNSNLNEDVKLLADFGGFSSVGTFPYLPQTVASLSGEVEVSDEGAGEYEIQLKEKWTKGGFSLAVDAVLTDYNGREQRTTKVISLGEKLNDCDLVLNLSKRFYNIGESISLNIAPTLEGKATTATGTVVAMRLSPADNMPQHQAYGYGDYYPSNYYSANIRGGSNYRRPVHQIRQARLNHNVVYDQTKRSMITAELIDQNQAKFSFDEPGAYKLVCIAKLSDGRELKNEIGCIVNEPQLLPRLILNLDKEEFRSDEELTGWIHSEVRNATALVTLRDSQGIKEYQFVELNEGVARLQMQIPKGIRYGATVEVEFLQGDSKLFANRFTRILPVDRMVQLEIKTKETYKPGDTVTVEFQANRAEEMDLVVSVFDQSLLGIAKGKSVDVKSFFLADERVAWRTNNYNLKKKFGKITYKELVDAAREKVDGVINWNELNQIDLMQLNRAVHHYDRGHYSLHGLVALLRNSGHEVLGPDSVTIAQQGRFLRFGMVQEETHPISVAEAISKMRGTGQFTATCRGDQLELRFATPMQVGFNGNAAMFPGDYEFVSGGNRMARGDASRAMVTGNGAFSNVSGQAFISHAVLPGAPPAPVLGEDSSVAVRRDFSDAAFWDAKVRTDKNGKAQVTFKLPDSLTNWQVVATTITNEMHVGHTKASFRTFKPIMVWPILPRIFTEGDSVQVYASVHNRTKEAQEIEVSLEVENGQTLGQPSRIVTVEAESQVPVYFQFLPGKAGFTQLLMKAKTEAGSDASLKRLPVAPMVATQAVTASGLIRDGGILDVPAGLNLNEAELEISIVPSLLDDALDTLGYLVEYPHGCVEQTMSRFLPAIAVKGVLDKANVKNEELEEKLPLVAAAGINRLLELQKEDGGWGWQRGSQTHEMMTPYALYGLLQAEKAGYQIPNPNAVQRGVDRLRHFINNMGTTNHPADRIYCMYVFSHRAELQVEWWNYISVLLDGHDVNGVKLEGVHRVDHETVKNTRKGRTLSDYALALALEMACKKEKKNLADRLAKELRSRAQGSAHSAYWKTAQFSRWGEDRFEVTAAVLKALVAYDTTDQLIPKILTFFANTKRGDRWNSTKDTAMILYAICDYLHTQTHVVSDTDSLEVIVGDWSQEIPIDSSQVTTIKVPAKQLLAGNNRVGFIGDLPGGMFRAVLTFQQRGMAIDPLSHGIAVERAYFLLNKEGKKERQLNSGDTVPRGSYIESLVVATHENEERMQFVLVENPKPACCEILPETDQRYDQTSTGFALREDKTQGVAYHHEQSGKELKDRCVLHAELAGKFMIPPARAELMYNTLEYGHSDAFVLNIE